ncbi:MAG: hypothetical protein AB1742_06815 [bacterium]
MNRTSRNPRRTRTLPLICLAACAASGCARVPQDLSYRFRPGEPPATYRFEITAGRIETDANGNEKEVLTKKNAAYFLAVEPLRRRDGKTWLKLEPRKAPGAGFGAVPETTGETVVMDDKGRIAERFGGRSPFGVELVFPELPRRRVKPGDSWSVKRVTKVGVSERELPWRYTYEGKGRGDSRNCRLITLAVRHEEDVPSTLPRGVRISIQARHRVDGELCFGTSRLMRARYSERTDITLSAAGGEQLSMKRATFQRCAVEWTEKD